MKDRRFIELLATGTYQSGCLSQKQQQDEPMEMESDIHTDDDNVLANGPNSSTEMSGVIARSHDVGTRASASLNHPDTDKLNAGSSANGGEDSGDGNDAEAEAIIQGEGGDEWTGGHGPNKILQSSGVGITSPAVHDDNPIDDIEEPRHPKWGVFIVDEKRLHEGIRLEEQQQVGEQAPEEHSSVFEKDLVQKQSPQDRNVHIDMVTSVDGGDPTTSAVAHGVERLVCAEATLCKIYACLQDGEERLKVAVTAWFRCRDEMSECEGSTNNGSRSGDNGDEYEHGEAPFDRVAFQHELIQLVALLSKQLEQENLVTNGETLHMLQFVEAKCSSLLDTFHKNLEIGEDCCSIDRNGCNTNGDDLASRVHTLAEQNSHVEEGFCSMESGDGITEEDCLVLRVRDLSGAVHKLLHSLRPVDLDKLIDLLRANSDVGDAIVDRDVLLLVGSTGSGKTTTLHFLAGSSFEEVEVDGFDHLRPVTIGHECLSSFVTSRSTRSVTRAMQSVQVCLDDEGDAHQIVICDSPGFDDTDGVEMDIANGWGLVRSVRRARSVKPVVVLSKEGVGDRFEGVSRVLSTVARLVGSSTEEKPDLRPFEYVFTKYDIKYAKRLHKQFRMKRKEMTSSERADKALVAFVDDIISKLQPAALIVAPLHDPDHDRLLRNLMNRGASRIIDPAKVFVPFVSEMAQDKLQLQLRMTLDKCEKTLRDGNIKSTLYMLQQLKSLAAVLPEAQECASSATSLCQYYIKERRSSFEMTIERCFLLRASKDAFWNELMSSKGDVKIILPLEHLRAVCLPSLDSGIDFCRGTLLGLARKLCQGIVDAHEERHSLQETISQHEQYVEAIDRTKDVCEMFVEVLPTSSNADDGGIKALYDRVCEILHYLIEEIVTQAEGHLDIFPETPLAEFASENRCLSYFLCKLTSRHDAAFKLGSVGSRRDKMIVAFEEKVKQSVAKSKENFEKCKGASCLSEIVHIDLSAADLAITLLDRLKLCPELVKLLPSFDMENLEDEAKHFDDTVADYLSLLSGCYQHQYDRIQRSAEIDGESMDILLQVAPEVMSVFKHLRDQSRGISKQSEPNFHKVMYVNTIFSNYLASLDNEPTEKKQSALSNAQRLLRRLKEGGFVVVVPKISEAWGEWSEILTRSQQKPKAGKLKKFFDATMSWAGWGSAQDAPTDGDTMALHLRKLCAQIIRQIRSEVNSSLVRLESVQWNNCDSTRLFLDHAHDVWTLTVLIALRVKETDLAKSVLEAFHHSWRSRALTPLVKFFRQVSSTWTNQLNRDSYAQVKRLLAAMHDTADFWSHSSDFANAVLKGKNGTDLLQLRESVLACKTYQVLHDEMMSRLFHIRSNTCEVSFLHNRYANSMNESDRNVFYEEVSRSYEATRQVHHLVGHLDAQVIDTASMRKDASKHLRSETELISKEIHHQLENFPNFGNDYRRLHLLYCSLQSIEGCLAGAAPDIAGFATCLLREVEGVLNRRLKSVLMNDSNTKDCDTTLPLLLSLKKASMELVCWRNALNVLIDQLLLKSSTKASSSGRYLLRLKSELEEVEGADALVARQLLCEHSCFRGAMNAIFNSATARQDIDYVIKSLTLPKEMHIIVKAMYTSFVEEYESLVVEGLTAMSCKDEDSAVTFFGDLARAVTEISQDYSLGYRTQLTHLTAHIFAYWSLKNTNDFVDETAAINLQDEAGLGEEVNGYLMKPHAAQVIAIWTLLNYQHEDYLMLKNHLIQILTGEGKSIVLGVSATVLALMGCEVECICYSSYLSSRDYSAFKPMFEEFDVIKHINYGTITSLCNRIIDEGGDLRDLTKDLALGEGKWDGDAKRQQSRKQTRARVLLVDEVDVFFKDDFYGRTHNPGAFVRHESISALMMYIWKNRANLNRQSLMQRKEVTDCLLLFPQEMQHLISNEIVLMLRDSYCAETKAYSVVEGKIGYKYLDGLNFASFYGYRTSFAYMLEYEKGNTTLQQVNENLYIRLRCGNVSFAEVPVMFDFILGVTGSLQGFSEKELSILRGGYNINSLTFLPSVYGNNKLGFAKDSRRDVILCDTKVDHFMEIRNEINNRRKPEKENGIPRPVMVFFATSKLLLECYNSEQMQDLKIHTRTITEDIRKQDKDGAFLRATLSGATTFLIREYGRGTDFKCFDDRVLDSGGAHVIQTFFSSELSEEVQIKGRTARQGTRGSYSMVLNGEDLSKEFSLTMDDVQAMRDKSNFCSYLGPVREKQYNKECTHRDEKVEEAEKLHYETLSYKGDLLDGNKDRAIAFLYKQHGLEHVSSLVHQCFPSNRHTKKVFLNAREKRWKEQEFDERFRRRAARDEHEKNVLTLESSSERTFYDFLGVKHTANSKEIRQAFRNMSRKYHPDKCKKTGSMERFTELNEAKEVLLCPRQRDEYDQMLKSKRNKKHTRNVDDEKDKTGGHTL